MLNVKRYFFLVKSILKSVITKFELKSKFIVIDYFHKKCVNIFETTSTIKLDKSEKFKNSLNSPSPTI